MIVDQSATTPAIVAPLRAQTNPAASLRTIGVKTIGKRIGSSAIDSTNQNGARASRWALFFAKPGICVAGAGRCRYGAMVMAKVSP